MFPFRFITNKFCILALTQGHNILRRLRMIQSGVNPHKAGKIPGCRIVLKYFSYFVIA